MINHYCGFEAGVRNLRKCIDRVFRKIVAKLENQKDIQEEFATQDISEEPKIETEIETELKEYQVNTKNLEIFLDIPSTDDHYYQDINQQLPVGCSNGLAYVDAGYGAVLKIQFVRKLFAAQKKESESASVGTLTHTGRLGDVMKESVEGVKIAVFNFLKKKFGDKNTFD